jgi:hypothetical protein
MAAPTNTVTTVANIGIREDLENDIYRIAPEETPFTSNIGKTKSSSTFHEWQTETIEAVDASNFQLEGDDVATLDSARLTTRVGNYTQIFRKSGAVAGTQEAVTLAGREDEMDRQKMLAGLALKRDVEARLIGNYASNAQSGGTPRKAGGALAWITSNDSRGSGGSDGGFGSGVVAAATNAGSTRTFTEALVKTMLATAFGNGARFSQAYMGGTHKQAFSAFTGIADIRSEVSGKSLATIYGAADMYVSDFGSITLIPHPYGLTRDALFVDPKMVAVATLRPVNSKALASSGDNEKFLLTTEKTLVVRNERGLGVVADLT